MNYPSLSLKQDLIDEVFYGVQKQLGQTPSPGAIRMKNHHRKQKERRLQTAVVEECDQCDYKSCKYMALYRHKREKHSVPKQTCADCDYSHIYPNRVKMHYDRVHRGMKRRRSFEKCRREFCEYAGTSTCLELQSHSLFFCEQCGLSFERSDDFKFHNDEIHEGLLFKCDYCEYSSARKGNLKKHIIFTHSEDESKRPTNPERRQIRNPNSCKEEGCTYKAYSGYELKKHIERKHEGNIIRLKCHLVNCNFETTWTRNLQRHAKVHLPESLKIEAKQH